MADQLEQAELISANSSNEKPQQETVPQSPEPLIIEEQHLQKLQKLQQYEAEIIELIQEGTTLKDSNIKKRLMRLGDSLGLTLAERKSIELKLSRNHQTINSSEIEPSIQLKTESPNSRRKIALIASLSLFLGITWQLTLFIQDNQYKTELRNKQLIGIAEIEGLKKAGKFGECARRSETYRRITFITTDLTYKFPTLLSECHYHLKQQNFDQKLSEMLKDPKMPLPEI